MQDILKNVLPWGIQRLGGHEDLAWNSVIGGALEALEVLRHPFPDEVDAIADLSSVVSARATLRRPRIFTLLEGAPPARILFDGSRKTAASSMDGDEICKELVESFVGFDDYRWTVDRPCKGPSSMAARVVRAVAEAHPQPFASVPEIGLTGELDDQGAFKTVEGYEDKLARFFVSFPQGLCFVPVCDSAKVRKVVGASRKVSDQSDDWRKRIFPVSDLAELFFMLGLDIGTDGKGALRRFRSVVPDSVVDWKRRERKFDALPQIPITASTPPEGWLFDDRPGFHNPRFSGPVFLTKDDLSIELDALMAQARLSPKAVRVVVMGQPGAGKSFFVKHLHYELCRGAFRLDGPSVLLRASEYIGDSTQDLLELIHDTIIANRVDESKRAGSHSGALLASHGLRWLLIDGLDEISAGRRELLLNAIQNVPFHVCLATRRLHEHLSNAWIVSLRDLNSQEVTRLLEIEGRVDLVPQRHDDVSALWQEPVSVADHLGSEVRQFARTPLGISLLADCLPAEATENISRQQLFERAIKKFIRRAIAAGRLPASIDEDFEEEPSRIIGTLAWRLLQSGASCFSYDDVCAAYEAVDGSERAPSAILKVINASGFIEPSGPDQWEFVIRSFAEYCAAKYPRTTPHRTEMVRVCVSRISEPTMQAVLTHLAMLWDPNIVLKTLLSSRQYPIVALEVASSILLERRDASVQVDMALQVLCRRLALQTYVGTQKPDREEHEVCTIEATATDRLLERWATRLKPHVGDLINACHPGVRTLLDGTRRNASRDTARCPVHRDDETSHDNADIEGLPDRVLHATRILAKAFDIRPPLRSLLFLGSRGDSEIFEPHERVLQQLAAEPRLRRPRERQELTALLEDTVVGQAALFVWLRVSAESEVQARLPQLMGGDMEMAVATLQYANTQGTDDIRRETLLRFVFRTAMFPPPASPSLYFQKFAIAVRDGKAAPIATVWDEAWNSGVLGWLSGEAEDGDESDMGTSGSRLRNGIGRSSRNLVLAYRHFLSDSNPICRLRAISAWFTAVERGWLSFATPEFGATQADCARRLLEDSMPETRIWTLAVLFDQKVFEADLVPSSLLSSKFEIERWFAWRLWLRSTNETVDVSCMLRAMGERAPSHFPRSPRIPSWHHPPNVMAGYHEFLEAAADRCVDVPHVRELIRFAQKGRYAREARRVLGVISANVDTRSKTKEARELHELLEPYETEYISHEGDDDCDDEPQGDHPDEASGIQVLVGELRALSEPALRWKLLTRYLLKDRETWSVAREVIRRSKNVGLIGRSEINRHLKQYPSCAVGRALFVEWGGTEEQLFQMWDELKTPWSFWPRKRSAPPKRKR